MSGFASPSLSSFVIDLPLISEIVSLKLAIAISKICELLINVWTILVCKKSLIQFYLRLYMKEKVECPKCNEVMLDVQACHLICPRCGSHMDCSDKGSVW